MLAGFSFILLCLYNRAELTLVNMVKAIESTEEFKQLVSVVRGMTGRQVRRDLVV